MLNNTTMHSMAYKDSHNSTLIQASTLKDRKKILTKMLENGLRATAVAINIMLGNNDGRKFISTLREKMVKENNPYEVRTFALRDNRNVYWLEYIKPQPNLFSELEGARYE